jgi:hypothetical protein
MDDVEDIISRLKFISKIQKNEKVNVKSMMVQGDSLLARISRTLINTDNRNNTFNFITSTVKRGFEILTLFGNQHTNFSKTMVDNILVDIEGCLKGLENLKTTYQDDVMYCCKLETLIQDINARLQDFPCRPSALDSKTDFPSRPIAPQECRVVSSEPVTKALPSIQESLPESKEPSSKPVEVVRESKTQGNKSEVKMKL